MKKIDDQTLMAFVDSELSEEESKKVERALADDQQAQSRVEEFRKTRTAIDQFAGILDEPVPDHLIETIRQYKQQPEVIQFPKQPRRSNWFLVAASLLAGVSLGGFGVKYLLTQSRDMEVAATASDIAGLAASLKAVRVEKNAALEKATTAEAKLADIAKALETAMAENGSLQEKVAATRTNVLPFPLSIVSQAVENGSKVSPDLQKIIVAELNTKDALVSTVSDFSRFSAGAANTGTLEDLQPTENPGKGSIATVPARATGFPGQSAISLKVFGEFSYAGKTCRLFEHKARRSPGANVLIACKKEAGDWEIAGR